MEQKTVINIAKDFGRYPAGRYPSDGPFNGEDFRDKHLVPALHKNSDTIYIELDGARGLASSFLEEAFGGLVRKGFEPQTLIRRFYFHSTDPSLIEEILGYIKNQETKDLH